jgi:hypothetical protein
VQSKTICVLGNSISVSDFIIIENLLMISELRISSIERIVEKGLMRRTLALGKSMYYF